MGQDIKITVEQGIIRVVYRGQAEFAAITRVLRDVGRIASETHSERLLFDLREADYRHYYTGAIRHAEEGPALGIEQRFRIAFLGAKDEPMLKYFEDVAVNGGYSVKAFADEQEAVAWLQSAL